MDEDKQFIISVDSSTGVDKDNIEIYGSYKNNYVSPHNGHGIDRIGQCRLNFDISIDLKVLNLDVTSLIGVSDCKDIILWIKRDDPYDFGNYLTECTEKMMVYIYSAISGVMLEKCAFDYNLDISICFIGSKNSERLFVNDYIMNPQNLSNNIDAKDLLKVTFEDNEPTLIKNVIISDYIIGIYYDHVIIKNLIHHKRWTDYVHYDKIDIYSCGNEIRQKIQSTLEKYLKIYETNLEYSQDISVTESHIGKICTWNVSHTTHDDYGTYNVISLEAKKINHENNNWDKVGDTIHIWTTMSTRVKNSSYKHYLMESWLLKSEDLLIISSFGIQIWTINSGKEITLLYYWVNFKVSDNLFSKTALQIMIEQITFLNNNLDFSKGLPPSPSFEQFIENDNNYVYFFDSSHFKCYDLLEYYMNNISLLKIYGKDLIRELVKSKKGLDILENNTNKIIYNDDPNNPWNLVPKYQSIISDRIFENPSLIENPDANTNLFTSLYTALMAVYFMLTASIDELYKYIKEIKSKNFEEASYSNMSTILKISKFEDIEENIAKRINISNEQINKKLDKLMELITNM
ncbi:16553_t:CDS:2 [Dentiscutata heterogama]|uniref:16553_t:CDS:1 n=1 Tax=Dentiscutata heterogama TaxID=1316150 RepID=A0ACA9KN83_9GLOM|nr:16553_t:CDS:2 [Dentiscutata heterogama]